MSDPHQNDAGPDLHQNSSKDDDDDDDVDVKVGVDELRIRKIEFVFRTYSAGLNSINFQTCYDLMAYTPVRRVISWC